MKKALLIFIIFVLSIHAASLEEKVDYLDNVKELVLLTQKMRGDTNVYIKGGNIYFSTVDDNNEKVAASLRSLRSKFNIVDIKTNNEFDKLNLYMQSLNDVASDLDNMVTFRAYTLLINEMIKLGIKVQKNFFLKGCERRQRVSAVMMQNILPMTEYIGRLRGLGAGMAVCGHCSGNEVDLSKEYLTDVSDELEKIVAAMKDLEARYPNSYPKNLDQQLEQYQVAIEQFVTLMEKKFSASEVGGVATIPLDSYDFLSYGTSLIEYTLSFYEMNKILLKVK